MKPLTLILSILLIGSGRGAITQQQPAASASPTMLTLEQLEKVIPATVFFRGQTSTVQLRNSAGLRLAGDSILFAVTVDTGGYSTSIQERYQDYLVTEVPLRFGTQTLPAGAYGAGFVGGTFVVMNVGGKELLNVPTKIDLDMKRPKPLQLLPATAGAYRLCSGRTCVLLTLAQQ